MTVFTTMTVLPNLHPWLGWHLISRSRTDYSSISISIGAGIGLQTPAQEFWQSLFLGCHSSWFLSSTSSPSLFSLFHYFYNQSLELNILESFIWFLFFLTRSWLSDPKFCNPVSLNCTIADLVTAYGTVCRGKMLYLLFSNPVRLYLVKMVLVAKNRNSTEET